MSKGKEVQGVAAASVRSSTGLKKVPGEFALTFSLGPHYESDCSLLGIFYTLGDDKYFFCPKMPVSKRVFANDRADVDTQIAYGLIESMLDWLWIELYNTNKEAADLLVRWRTKKERGWLWKHQYQWHRLGQLKTVGKSSAEPST